jgi:hypothetical protein
MMAPFIAIGLYFVFGHFLYDAYVRSREVYGLTNLRLIVLKGEHCTSSSVSSLPQLTLSSRNFGRGTINFSPAVSDGDGGTNSGPARGTSFKFIKNASAVYEMIMQQQKNTRY